MECDIRYLPSFDQKGADIYPSNKEFYLWGITKDPILDKDT